MSNKINQNLSISGRLLIYVSPFDLSLAIEQQQFKRVMKKQGAQDTSLSVTTNWDRGLSLLNVSQVFDADGFNHEGLSRQSFA